MELDGRALEWANRAELLTEGHDMVRFAFLLLVLLAGASVAPAQAASFDCAKVSTPFESTICGNDDLSAADDRLAKTYATAVGGLSKKALDSLKADQRLWLDYAHRACTPSGKPLAGGERYDERGTNCLVDIFTNRSQALETSRMIEGLRFYPKSRFSSAPDPYEADNPDSYFPVSRHELSYVQLDADKSWTAAFNAMVLGEADTVWNGQEAAEEDASSDSTNSITVKEVAGEKRITLEFFSYSYGHGAAHGNHGTSYLHFLPQEERLMVASDIFAKDGWEAALLDLAYDALKKEHGDNLYLDDKNDIAKAVADPARWDISNPYGLVIQFQPYEVAAYAYGTPTATVSWDALADYLADTAESLRYGF
jgi:uncharacterized protein YecT (DUF1311 family)